MTVELVSCIIKHLTSRTGPQSCNDVRDERVLFLPVRAQNDKRYT